MVIVVPEDQRSPNIKKRMVLSDDVFVRARDFYHAHEDMRGEHIQVTDGQGSPILELAFQKNELIKPEGFNVPTYIAPYWNYGPDTEGMDLTYLESHDAYLFCEIEEYSLFMARLISDRFPEKPVAFIDERATLFAPFEIVPSKETLLELHPEAAAEHTLMVESRMYISAALRDATMASSVMLMAGTYWATDVTSFGERNPDKTFYLIKPAIGESGLAKFVEFTLGAYDTALSRGNGIVPVIDTGLPGDVNQFNGGNGTDVWNTYFEPLCPYSLEEVYDSARVIVSQEGNYTANPYLLEIKRHPNVSPLIKRYVRLNEPTLAYAKKVYDEVMPEDHGRVLSVVGRGTDFNNPVILRVRQRPLTPEELVTKVEERFREGEFDSVFLATEDQRVFDAFQASALADVTYSVDQPRYDLTAEADQNKLLADVYSDKERANEWDGYQESLRYLAILYILAQSDALVASTECGATIFAEGYREVPFEFVDIYGK